MRSALVLLLGGSLFAADVVADPIAPLLAKTEVDRLVLDDLDRGLAAMAPDARVVAIGRIAASGRGEFAEIISRRIDDHDAVVAVAAVEALGAMWPTSIEDVTKVRSLITHGNDQVAHAAAAFAVRVKDEEAIEALTTRLAWDGQDTATRQALQNITHRSFESASEWRDWSIARAEASDKVMADIDAQIASGDPVKMNEAVALMVSMPDRSFAVVSRLVALSAHENPDLARLASAGVATSSGALADLWRAQRASGSQTGSVITAAATATAGMADPEALASTAPILATAAAPRAENASSMGGMSLVLGLIVVIGGALWWMRGRKKVAQATPVASTKPVSQGEHGKHGPNHIQVTWAD